MASAISPGTFLKSQNGQVYYAYSGVKNIGGTSQVIINIKNTGLEDLMATLTATADWSQVAQYLGVAIDINGEAITYMVNDTAAGVDIPSVWTMGFFCPAQSSLTVTSYNDGASSGATRSAMLVASPLRTV